MPVMQFTDRDQPGIDPRVMFPRTGWQSLMNTPNDVVRLSNGRRLFVSTVPSVKLVPPAQMIAEIWSGPHPDNAPDFKVTNDPIPTLTPIQNLPAEPQVGSPEVVSTDPGFVKEVANRVFGTSVNG